MDFTFENPETKLYGLTIFIAVVIFQVAYILLQWFFLRRKEYIYYALYMLSTVFYALGEFEVILPFKLFTRFVPDYYFLSRHSAPLISLFFYYRFTRAYLSIPVLFPVFDKWLVKIEYMLIIYSILAPILILSGVSIAAEEMIFVAVSIVLAISTFVFIYIVILNFSPLARFAMLGASLLVTGSMVTLVLLLLRDKGIDLPFDPFLPLLLCVVAELLTFTTGLSDKTNLIEKEKVAAEKALVAQLKEKERIQNDMYLLRNKIASDLHDDIGATLSSIGMFSEIAKAKPQLGPEVLAKISTASTEMVERMNDIVWSVNPANDNFEKLAARILNFSVDYLSAKGISFHYQLPAHTNDLCFSMEQNKNMFLILKECIHNAVKYANCTKINLHLSRINNHSITMNITDNGSGFDPQKVNAYNGNGLSNMKMRAAAINGSLQVTSAAGSGTSVTLQFDLEQSPN